MLVSSRWVTRAYNTYNAYISTWYIQELLCELFIGQEQKVNSFWEFLSSGLFLGTEMYTEVKLSVMELKVDLE